MYVEVGGNTITANDIELPDIGIKPYIEYGVGTSKEYEGFSFFVEGLRRNGGREGWEGQLSFNILGNFKSYI